MRRSALTSFEILAVLYMDNIPTWLAFTISGSIGLAVAIIVQLFIVPWQRRAVSGEGKHGKPVKFTIDGSTESTPCGSPKRNRRPASLVAEGKPLPAITETTELVSFNNLCGVSPGLYSDQNFGKNVDLNEAKRCNGNYKIDPKIIQKAENLLGKASLDNTDLTITSLNYIDEQHGMVNGKTLQNCFDRQNLSPDAMQR